MTFRRELVLLYLAGFLRSLGVGLLGVVLGVYLYRLHFDSIHIGTVIAAGLCGATSATAFLGFSGDRIGRRPMLVLLALLSALGGIALVLRPAFPLLVVLAFAGMLNGMGTDRSATFALEQAIIPSLIGDRSRTWALSWANVVLETGGAVGALAGGLPLLLQSRAGIDMGSAYRGLFAAYAVLQLIVAGLYTQLPASIEAVRAGVEAAGEAVSARTRSVVRRLSTLFSLDAFGGGFLGDALVAYWFFRRFGIHEGALGLMFFAVRILNAGSQIGAGWLARRIGLVNTMVFTHLPSSLLLILVPFAPTPALAIALFLARESLVEMDVPARQSYVAAVVAPRERTYASAITNLTRTLAWAAGSAVGGVAMQRVSFSAPLVIGASLKIGYDLLLFRNFRHVKPPEEVSRSGAAS